MTRLNVFTAKTVRATDHADAAGPAANPMVSFRGRLPGLIRGLFMEWIPLAPA